MFEDFEPFTTVTQTNPEVTIHGLRSRTPSWSRPTLLLLHGFPQTHHIWHKVAPRFTSEYNVVIPDLRGYGASSKPAGDVAAYAKSAMARDAVAVVDAAFADKLRRRPIARFDVVAHDRGARVAHKLCVDYPQRVRRAVLLDICPTLAMYEATDQTFASAYWHWFFLIQPAPLPETLLARDPRTFAELFMGGRQARGVSIFDAECFEAYIQGLGDPDTVHAMCQDYRASASLDMDEAREDLKEGRRIQTPLLVLWGKHGVIEKCFDALKEWRAVTAEGVPVKGRSIESGHYIPEEAPDELVSAVQDFFA